MFSLAFILETSGCYIFTEEDYQELDVIDIIKVE